MTAARDQQVFALIGHPVAHSRSPRIHQMFARASGISLEYGLLDLAPDQLRDGVAAFFDQGGAGLNVTVPHKQAVLALADQITPAARAAGAANTLIPQADGQLLADNTDGAGLVRDLTRNLGWSLRGARVLLLGAGGASRGVIGPLLEVGAGAILISNRTSARADALVADVADARVRTAPERLAGPVDLLLNATAAGLAGALPQVPENAVGAQTRGYDMVYGPAAVAFASWCAQAGLRQVADGLGMLVEQAAEAFQRWQGIRPDTGPVLVAMRRELAAEAAEAEDAP